MAEKNYYNINKIHNVNGNLKENLKKFKNLNIGEGKKILKVNSEEKIYLSNRKWDYLDESKKEIIEKKVNYICKNMDKEQLQKLEASIKRCNLNILYQDFNPREVIKGIGTLSSLDFLIESKYTSSANIKDMFSDKSKLEVYIYKFRNIQGDGDCFYRGVIFSLMENIVLTNNIMQMKELLVLFYEKINKNNPVIKQKEYLSDQIEKINIDIISQLLYSLINYMETKDISSTYLLLLKAFIYCPPFDYGILFFTRYLLYEYISANENKIYSKENQIEIGCLLPEEFVSETNDKNQYFFDNYYSLQLMKPKTFAEKLVIYITPFVFNCDLNIIMYEFGKNIEEKYFKNEKDSNFHINLLYHSCHYDIFYKKYYYEQYREQLDMLTNIQENIVYLNSKNPEEYENKDNKISPKTNNYIKDNSEKNSKKDIEELKDNNNYNNNNNDYLQCLQCQQFYSHRGNIFGLCNYCLSDILKDKLYTYYLTFLQKGMYNHGIIFKEYFLGEKCSISLQENILLEEAFSNSELKFEDLFLEIKKNMCLYCGNNKNMENDKFYLEFPCQCRICSKHCFQKFMELFVNKNNLIKNNVGHPLNMCPCGYFLELNSIFKLIHKIEKMNLSQNYKEILQKLIANNWKFKCMICRINFTQEPKKFFILDFKDDNINKKYLPNKIEFQHLICASCKKTINEKSKMVDCIFCKSKHTIKKIKELDDEGCLII